MNENDDTKLIGIVVHHLCARNPGIHAGEDVNAETSDSYNRRSIDIYADDQPHRDKYSCDFQIRLHETERDSGLYEIWCLRDSDSTKDKRRFISCRFNSDALMLSLYTARTKIKVGDFDEFDIDELAQEAMSEWNEEHGEERW